jgi:hypothetical protein
VTALPAAIELWSGKSEAMAEPVKVPAQLFSWWKKRIAVNDGRVPMSNRCVVPRGTPSRSLLLAQHRMHLVVDVQAEDAGAGDEEADLVVMRVLLEEFLARGLRLRPEPGVSVGVQCEDVDGGKPHRVVEPVDLRAVRREHRLAVRVGRQVLAYRPSLEAHPERLEGRGDCGGVGRIADESLGTAVRPGHQQRHEAKVTHP